MIYKGNPTVMLWNQSETDTPRREKFGRCLAAARAHPPRPVRPPRSGRAQSKRHLSSRNDRFIAREAIYKEISFINQCKCCVFCENPAKLFIASRHSYRRAVRPPSGGFLVERHNRASIERVSNAFESFRPGIYLVNIL